MTTHETLQAKLVERLQEAAAMETEIAQVLQRQIDSLDPGAALHVRLKHHLAETKLQHERLAARLTAYDQQPSAMKEAGATLKGLLAGLSGMIGYDRLAFIVRTDYVTEHMEIAMYASLIAAARAIGDVATVHVAETNMGEEVEMANWLLDHLEAAYHEDLAVQGVPAIDLPRQQGKASIHVTFEPSPSQPATSRKPPNPLL